MNRSITVAVACLFICIQSSRLASGQSLQPVIFTIDPTSTISMTSFWASGQGPNGEGSTAPVQGHFLVNFDPTDSTPDTIGFEFGHGYLDAQPTGSWGPGSGPADFGLFTPFGSASIRNVVWDFFSGAIANNGDNSFNASAAGVKALSMDADTSNYGYFDLAGEQAQLVSGTASLDQTGDQWTLSMSGLYRNTGLVDQGVNAPVDFTIDVVAMATFGASNIDAVVPDPITGNVTASVLGGEVAADFTGVAADSKFSAQELFSNTAFSLAALQASENNNTFALSTGDPSIIPQFWEVSLTDDNGDDVDFGTALIKINYEDSGFAPGFNENQLGIWHYNSELGDWESFSVAQGNATVDSVSNTISFEVENFSEIQLGVFAVPEPSTLVLACCGLFSLIFAVKRRRRAAA
ncbi:MAG: hypothetical protein RIC12_00010 [Pirellulales bacterium]